MPIEQKGVEHSPVIQIHLPDNSVLEGEESLTLIGANGAGKTRLGTWFVANRGYDRVSAQRSIAVAEIAMMPSARAAADAESVLQHTRTNSQQPSHELANVLSDFKAQDVDSATAYKQKGKETAGSPGEPDETKLDVLVRLWESIFPGRQIDFRTYNPQARWNHANRSTEPYSTSEMSDGERSALFRIARLLRAKPGVVIIDEPEIHFHSLLARRFWDAVEAERTDCRFIYITHDIPFALSRRGRLGIVKGPAEVQLLPTNGTIPADLVGAILGAASLSVLAQRIVFCEGDAEGSVDMAFYGAWFEAPTTAVVPVGNCDEVKRTTDTFRREALFSNAQAIGIVERDYWSEDYLQKLVAAGLHVLPTSEVEGLLSLKQVAKAVAEQIGIHNFDERYQLFESRVQSTFQGMKFNKVVLERAKREIDLKILGLPNSAYPRNDLDGTRQVFVSVVDLVRAVPDVGAVFDFHAELAGEALRGGPAEMLRVFPGKDCLGLLVDVLGVTKDRYLELVCGALRGGSGEGAQLHKLHGDLVLALSPHLPSRS